MTTQLKIPKRQSAKWIEQQTLDNIQEFFKIPFRATGLVGIAFLALKLIGIIDWSWLWATAPFWGGLAIWTVFFIVMLIIESWIQP